MKRIHRLPLLLLVLTLTLPWRAAGEVTASKGGAETERTVTGVEVARPGGGFLGLAIEGNAFVLRFYDEEKNEIPPDAAAHHAPARWNNPQKAGWQRTVLVNNGNHMHSPAVVRPPHVFIVYLSLYTADSELIESHTFNTRKLP